jgi:energy-converting hydrogenase Eha subunit A
MCNSSLSAFSQEKIARLAEDALRRSQTIGVFPTPIIAVQQTLGVRERISMRELPSAIWARKPGIWSRILGAYWYDERVVFIDEEQPEQRRFWTDAHEAGHAMCGWHAPVLRLDNEDTLFKQLHAGVEAEANFGAGYLIFQGGRFHREALKEQVSIRTPLALAAQYGASRHATLRYYTEHHPYAVALLVAGRYPYADGSIPIWNSIESADFKRRFGCLQEHLPDGKLRIRDASAPFADILQASHNSVDPPSTIIGLHDTGGTSRRFVAESFFNQRTHFVLVAERRATRLGRRVQIAS